MNEKLYRMQKASAPTNRHAVYKFEVPRVVKNIQRYK